MTHGTILRKYRDKKGYSQKYVANELGISQNAYSKMENDKTKMKAETIEKVATVLEVDKQKLLKDNAYHIEQHNHDNSSHGVVITNDEPNDTKILQANLKSQKETIESQKETIKSQSLTIELLQAELVRLREN